MLWITGWWTSLDQSHQIFWGIAIIATALFLIQVILSLIGLGADLEADFDDIDGGFSLISFRSVIAFLMFFGWGGVVSLYQGFDVSKAVMIAVLTGFLAMLGVAYLLAQMLKMQESGTVNLSTTIREFADVYLTIPGKKKGLGKIHIPIDGKTMEFNAMTAFNEIGTGERVQVMEIMENNVMLVRPIN